MRGYFGALIRVMRHHVIPDAVVTSFAVGIVSEVIRFYVLLSLFFPSLFYLLLRFKLLRFSTFSLSVLANCDCVVLRGVRESNESALPRGNLVD